MHPTLTNMQEAYPPHEFEAVSAWMETFYEYQKNWLLDWRKLAAIVKCRQIGGSHTIGGGWPVLRGMLGEDAVLVSIRDEEAKDLLDQANMHAEILGELNSKWAAPVRRTKHSLILGSGAEIRSTTSSAAGRGFSGNVVLDEFAYMPNQEATWDSALAATMQGFGARIISTPNGAGDIWHQLCTEIGESDPKDFNKWKIYLTTVHDAILDGLNINLDECWEMARHDPRVFAQLFEGAFLDGNFQYIPSELIKRQTTELSADPYGECFGGIDIGETRDKTSLIVLQGHPTCFRVKHVEVHDRTDDELLRKMIDEALHLHKCKRICIDKTGMGTFPAAEAVRTHGPKVEPISFDNKNKEAMAGRLYQTLADGLLWLPAHGVEAANLRNDVMSIRRTVTEVGTVRFDAPRTAKGHADRAWALMMAVQASSLAGIAGVYSDMRSLLVRGQ